MGGLCLEVSLGTWEHDLFLDDYFSDRKRPLVLPTKNFET